MATILVFFPTVDRQMTENKCYVVGKWLAEAGHKPVFLTWDPDSDAVLTEIGQFPHLRLVPRKLDCVPHIEAKKAWALLNRPIIPAETEKRRNGETETSAPFPDSPIPRFPDSFPVQPPTYGDLLAFDDFLGCVQAWDFAGTEIIGKPDVIVTSIPGLESASPEDASLSLALDRFAKANHVPIIGLEVQSLRTMQHLAQRPVDFLLTQGDPRGYPAHVKTLAPVAFPLPVAHRYCFRPGKDLALEQFLNVEFAMRHQLPVPAGERILFLQFHLGWKSDIVAQLQRVNGYAPALRDANFGLLIATNPSTVRRSMTESDIVRFGIAPRWLEPWAGRWRVVDGGLVYLFALLAEAVLTPFDGALASLLAGWGMPLIRPGEEEQLDDLACGVSLAQAVAWILQQKQSESLLVSASASRGSGATERPTDRETE